MSNNQTDKRTFTKDNLDTYLKELAKEFRKLNGKTMPAEIILVGGAAVLAGYGFRDMTTDIDAIIYASSAMNEAINKVRDKFDLPHGWINTDFMKTKSYSKRIIEFSKYYKTYANILSIRIISGEYLLAMKLCSARRYKKDISDIIGILYEHEKQNNPITFEKVEKAVFNLYGGWDSLPEGSKAYILDIIQKGKYEEAYYATRKDEILTKNLLSEFEEKYPNIVTETNLKSIINSLKSKK